MSYTLPPNMGACHGKSQRAKLTSSPRLVVPVAPRRARRERHLVAPAQKHTQKHNNELGKQRIRCFPNSLLCSGGAGQKRLARHCEKSVYCFGQKVNEARTLQRLSESNYNLSLRGGVFCRRSNPRVQCQEIASQKSLAMTRRLSSYLWSCKAGATTHIVSIPLFASPCPDFAS